MTRINKSYIAFLVFALLLILHHVFFYVGHYGYDDLHYAELAVKLKDGFWDINDHYSFRIVIIGAALLSFIIFGVNDFATAFPTLLVSIGILYIVYRLLKERGLRTLIIGLALVTLSKWFLFYSDKLMPDIFVALGMFTAIYAFYRVYFKYKTGVGSSVMLVLSLLFGFLSKGTIIFILPLLIYYFIVDIIHKKNKWFWTRNMLIGITLAVLYFVLIGMLTGDPWKRFSAVVDNSYLNICSYHLQPVGVLLNRILVGFWKLLINHGTGISLVFIIAGLWKKRRADFLKLNDPLNFWTATSLILLFSSNFLSVSFTDYSPMCLDPRHYLFLIPVMAVAASLVIHDLIKNGSNKFIVLTITILVAVFSIFIEGKSFYKFHFPLLLIILLYLFVGRKSFSQNVFIILFVAALLIQPISLFNNALRIDYIKQKQIYFEQVKSISEPTVIITNDVQKRLSKFYNEFKNSQVEVFNYDEFTFDSTDNRKQILLLNEYTRLLSGLQQEDLPYYAKYPSEGNSLIYDNPDIGISIYEMKGFISPSENGVLLFSSEVNSGKLTLDTLHNATIFQFELDSINVKEYKRVVMIIDGFVKSEAKTDAKIEVSMVVENEKQKLKFIELNNYIKAYSHWWQIKNNLEVNVAELSGFEQFLVSVKNETQDKIFLNQFRVAIYAVE